VTPDARAGDAVALTRELVSIESVNPTLEAGGSGEAQIAAFVADVLAEWGFDPVVTEAAPGRCNVRATRGAGNGPSLLLNGHLDTVGVDGMTIDPFAAAIEGDRLFGRGACDMKAGLACILTTAFRLRDAQIPGRLDVLFTADEEHASLGMQSAVAEGALASDFAVVTEPTSLAVMPAHKGFAWVKASFQGRAAHGSRPEMGIDAIRSAGRLIGALDDLERRIEGGEPHPLLNHGSVHAGTIVGGSAPSVYPDMCELRLERRTLPSEDPAGFETELRELLESIRSRHPEVHAELETELVRDGSDVALDHPGVTALLGALAHAGEAQHVAGMTAWVDAAFLNAIGIPAICFGPGSIGQAHSEDEWVSVPEIERGAEVLARFARAMLQVDR